MFSQKKTRIVQQFSEERTNYFISQYEVLFAAILAPIPLFKIMSISNT